MPFIVLRFTFWIFHIATITANERGGKCVSVPTCVCVCVHFKTIRSSFQKVKNRTVFCSLSLSRLVRLLFPSFSFFVCFFDIPELLHTCVCVCVIYVFLR